jgi:hypothetical protein
LGVKSWYAAPGRSVSTSRPCFTPENQPGDGTASGTLFFSSQGPFGPLVAWWVKDLQLDAAAQASRQARREMPASVE